MPCNAKKDLSNCLARAKIVLLGGKHFFSIYLWDSKEDLNEQAKIDGGDAIGACCHMERHAEFPARTTWRWFVLHFTPNFIKRRLIKFKWRTYPKAGELHFVRDEWTTEIVAHECLHATFGAMRAYGINPELACDGGGELSPHLADTPAATEHPGAISDEELSCYLHGELVEAVFNWLWSVNPYGKHSN